MKENQAKIQKDWKKILDPAVYKVTRKNGTEPAFSGKYYKEKRNGKYLCSNCQSELFDSSAKYDSGTGWPSFYAPSSKEAILEHEDRSFGMRRTEVRCSACDAHLGHVFPDGPVPTGLRYCINSLSLHFEANP